MQEQLYSRLKNCLLTILELEPELERLQLSDAFHNDLTCDLKLLKQQFEKIEDIDEKDLRRIEAATATLLKELRLPFSHLHPVSTRRGLLQ